MISTRVVHHHARVLAAEIVVVANAWVVDEGARGRHADEGWRAGGQRVRVFTKAIVDRRGIDGSSSCDIGEKSGDLIGGGKRGMEEGLEGGAGVEVAAGCVLNCRLEGRIESVEEMGNCGRIPAPTADDKVLATFDNVPMFGARVCQLRTSSLGITEARGKVCKMEQEEAELQESFVSHGWRTISMCGSSWAIWESCNVMNTVRAS